MKWMPGRRSRNLEDRRAERGPRRRVRFPTGRGRPGVQIPLPRGKGGIGTLVLVLVAAYFLGIDPLALLGGAGGIGSGVGVQVPMGSGEPFDVASRGRSAPSYEASPEEERLVDFVSFVLDDAQGTWSKLLRDYRNAKLVLFRDGIRSACGSAESAMGPFYCPADQKVYIDLAFYEELQRRFGAPGDFAQAYVLAHEIGHHVQNITGIEREVRRQQSADPKRRNELSVRMELQADCFAGVWAHSTKQRDLLDRGDVEEGMAAASAVGDDAIQRMAGRHIQPDGFTHGSSEQRVAWFRRGLDVGDPAACDSLGSGD